MFTTWRIVPIPGLVPARMRYQFVQVDHHDVTRPLWLLQRCRLPYNGLSTIVHGTFHLAAPTLGQMLAGALLCTSKKRDIRHVELEVCVMRKSVGIVRKLDALHRVILPKSLRDTLDIPAHTSVEVFIEEDCIVLRKYSPGCVFCGQIDGTRSASPDHLSSSTDRLPTDSCSHSR